MNILMERTLKLLAVVAKNKTLSEEYAKDNLELYLDEENNIPYIEYGEFNHLYDQMNKDEYTKWKNKVRYHLKNEGIICDSNTYASYTLKEFIK